MASGERLLSKVKLDLGGLLKDSKMTDRQTPVPPLHDEGDKFFLDIVKETFRAGMGPCLACTCSLSLLGQGWKLSTPALKRTDRNLETLRCTTKGDSLFLHLCLHKREHLGLVGKGILAMVHALSSNPPLKTSVIRSTFVVNCGDKENEVVRESCE